MSKTRKRLQMIAVALFIGVNILLVYMDDDGKVDRIAYVSHWTAVFQSDLEKKIHTTGVLASAQENHVYFDPSTGSFEAFAVEEGSSVQAGDALFSYKVARYQEAMSKLLEKRTQLEEELAAVEQAMTQMTALQIPEVNLEADAGLEWTEEVLKITIPLDPVQANLVKQQFLLEKEKEAAQKQAALASVDRQLAELEETGDTITVESPYEGIITQLSEQLNDPIITVSGTELHVAGELTEQERVYVKKNLPVDMEVMELNKSLTGTVTQVSETPKEEAAAKTSSIYPFIIELKGANEQDAARDSADETEDNEQDKKTKDKKMEGQEQLQSATERELLSGYHVDIDIITDTSEEAPVLNEAAIFQKDAWKMTESGKVIRQQLTTGIEKGDRIEITSGLDIGDKVALQPESQLRSQAAFITPLKWENGFKRTMSPKGMNWFEFFVTGIVSR
ncbi:efflux RND transporter periplasmic adaptor subunit [Virgibacillus pantothenticus]|uniref:efflux RND transporter periplasmic adaptor subunit n=1 Tax=Virgibacillus pantothenticus TaxID=1473 RepID=UPI0025B14B23|nr:HlyD family efflux transporter periplasmic adaptor subunit [Virgibacillus pantothenticus]